MENKVTLAKFFRFVVLGDQDGWMYQNPSTEDIKLAKGDIKKECNYENIKLPKFHDDDNSADQ